MNQDKEKLAVWVEEHQAEMVDFLKRLVQIPSDNPAGDCYPIATFLHKQLSEYGLEDVSLLQGDEVEVKESGMISLANVVAKTALVRGMGLVSH